MSYDILCADCRGTGICGDGGDSGSTRWYCNICGGKGHIQQDEKEVREREEEMKNEN